MKQISWWSINQHFHGHQRRTEEHQQRRPPQRARGIEPALLAARLIKSAGRVPSSFQKHPLGGPECGGSTLWGGFTSRSLQALLGLDGVQDGLPLGLVALADLLDLLLHLRVQRGQPLPQLLHRPRHHLHKHRAAGVSGERHIVWVCAAVPECLTRSRFCSEFKHAHLLHGEKLLQTSAFQFVQPVAMTTFPSCGAPTLGWQKWHSSLPKPNSGILRLI